MKKHLLFAVMMILAAAKLASAQTLDNITVYTEEYPPWNFTENGKTTGMATELVEHIFKELNSKKTVNDIKMDDWNTGYTAVLKGPNTMIYCISKTPGREKLFKWVGPILQNMIVAFVPKNSGIKVQDDSDLNKYKIAVIKGDVGMVRMQELGIPEANLVPKETVEENFADLEAGRADIWIYGEMSGKYFLKKAGIADKYEDQLTVHRGANYIALSMDVDDTLVEAMQEVVDKSKESGVLDQIINKYVK